MLECDFVQAVFKGSMLKYSKWYKWVQMLCYYLIYEQSYGSLLFLNIFFFFGLNAIIIISSIIIFGYVFY